MLSPIIQVLVIVFTLAPGQMKYYFFEDHIIKEYVTGEAFQDLITTRYEIYDLKTDKVYVVTKDENVLKEEDREVIFGSWKAEGQVVTKVETRDTTCLGYDCLMEIEFTKSDTPLGVNDSQHIKYYADLSDLLKKYKKKSILHFLGVRELKYKPYLFNVKQEIKFEEEDSTFTILSAEILTQEMEIDVFDEILAYPKK